MIFKKKTACRPFPTVGIFSTRRRSGKPLARCCVLSFYKLVLSRYPGICPLGHVLFELALQEEPVPGPSPIRWYPPSLHQTVERAFRYAYETAGLYPIDPIAEIVESHQYLPTCLRMGLCTGRGLCGCVSCVPGTAMFRTPRMYASAWIMVSQSQKWLSAWSDTVTQAFFS